MLCYGSDVSSSRFWLWRQNPFPACVLRSMFTCPCATPSRCENPLLTFRCKLLSPNLKVYLSSGGSNRRVSLIFPKMYCRKVLLAESNPYSTARRTPSATLQAEQETSRCHLYTLYSHRHSNRGTRRGRVDQPVADHSEAERRESCPTWAETP